MNPGLDLIGRMIGVYRVEALIGAGGYSRVYRAVDQNIGRPAAIKVLLPPQEPGGYDARVVQRFEREARIVANLRDPHSVLLYEYGQTDDHLLYMIFEYIEGHTLEEVRRQTCALPALRAVKILEQVLLSLEEAHAMGLIHRDIKPANIMIFDHIGRTDQVKVLDFGVGKAIGQHSESAELTQAGTLIGTPRYMAPEQWSSDGDISPQTDIYSLGLVAYELLTGARAITAAEPVHIMRAHLDPKSVELPPDLDIPSGLRQVVNRMLQKPRSRRYATVSEVLHDLTNLKPPKARLKTLNVATLPDPERLPADHTAAANPTMLISAPPPQDLAEQGVDKKTLILECLPGAPGRTRSHAHADAGEPSPQSMPRASEPTEDALALDDLREHTLSIEAPTDAQPPPIRERAPSAPATGHSLLRPISIAVLLIGLLVSGAGIAAILWPAPPPLPEGANPTPPEHAQSPSPNPVRPLDSPVDPPDKSDPQGSPEAPSSPGLPSDEPALVDISPTNTVRKPLPQPPDSTSQPTAPTDAPPLPPDPPTLVKPAERAEHSGTGLESTNPPSDVPPSDAIAPATQGKSTASAKSPDGEQTPPARALPPGASTGSKAAKGRTKPTKKLKIWGID